MVDPIFLWLQRENLNNMEKGDLTYRIIGCAMKVHNELGMGFREYIYCRALAIALRMEGISFEREIWLPIHFLEYRIGARRCDFLCENKVVLELKARRDLSNDDFVQAKNTVERLNQSDGLLLNFGGPNLQTKRIFNSKVRPESEFKDITPELVGELDDELFEYRQYMPDWLIEIELIAVVPD